MATITLDYDARNMQAKKALEHILSSGFFTAQTTKKKTRIEQGLEDYNKGRVFYINGPKKSN
jgi:predicted transcriptional regulator